MTRSEVGADAIRSAGATPAVADALDATAVENAIKRAQPEAIIHELTAIPAELDIRRFAEQFATTNLLRTRGTDHLLAASRLVGTQRFVAQSYAAWPYARTGGPVKTEADPFDPNPPAAMRETLQAIEYLESAVLGSSGVEAIILRYGGFYGPGNGIGEGGSVVKEVRRRRVPIVGKGTAIWSFIHIDDAAQATVAALEHGPPGVYNIVDDEPATVSEWLPALAKALGAKPPLRIPAWLGRLVIGEHGVIMMTELRGASNEKAKRELGWKPYWTTWRDGFRNGLEDKRI
jgi:nucleoside-diphosphate-sugar epimerase